MDLTLFPRDPPQPPPLRFLGIPPDPNPPRQPPSTCAVDQSGRPSPELLRCSLPEILAAPVSSEARASPCSSPRCRQPPPSDEPRCALSFPRFLLSASHHSLPFSLYQDPAAVPSGRTLPSRAQALLVPQAMESEASPASPHWCPFSQTLPRPSARAQGL